MKLEFFYHIFKLASPLLAVVGLLLAYKIFKDLLAKPTGTDRMREIAEAIRTGANSYLRAQFNYLILVVVVVFFLIWLGGLGFPTAVAYVVGAFSSLAAGFLGMRAATAANVRTAYAASQKNPAEALAIAFNGGAVMGLAVAALGVAGLGILFYFFGTPGTFEPMVGFGMGASSVALFARVGGGIYTKAADVGADLVGKVEAGIPEDDPRNPGVIADNVGDNVGDVAGMGADIYESYVTCLIGCMALATTMGVEMVKRLTDFDGTGSLEGYKIWLMLTPIAVGVLGMIASVAGIRAMDILKNGDPGAALRNSSFVATGVLLVLSFFYFWLMPVDLQLWLALVIGNLCGIGIGLLTEYFTGSKPVYKIVEGAKTGPATCIISGIAVGYQSCVFPILLIVATVVSSFELGGFYGVALAGVGMLATIGITMTIDAYGPIADNAGGISEMAELGTETREITDRLDALGNTTAAIGKGFAIGSAGVAALSIFGAYVEILGARNVTVNLEITNPMLIAGAFIGALLPALVTSYTMRAVGRAAGLMVQEIRRQFKEIPGLLEGKAGVRPDVGKCVDISTKAALTEMIAPGVFAAVTPLVVGLVLGPAALGGLLLGTTLVGVLLGMFMSNTGGAWDNAKKFIEQGKVEGEKKGSPAHKAAVVGDTVGDPFKDTSGPSLNILIKMVSMLALLIAPLFGNSDTDPHASDQTSAAVRVVQEAE